MEVKNRRELMAECMRVTFEERVAEKLSEDLSLEELDKWLDPLIKQYFRELDLVFRFYNPESYENGEELLLEDESIAAEKAGLINHLEKQVLIDQAADVMKDCSSLQDADEKIIKLLEQRKKRFYEIRKFYGLDDSEDAQD